MAVGIEGGLVEVSSKGRRAHRVVNLLFGMFDNPEVVLLGPPHRNDRHTKGLSHFVEQLY
jgi:hypothetical protein